MAILPDLLRLRASTTPNMVALDVDGTSPLRFNDWELRSNAVGRGLAAKEVDRGHRVALVFDNSWLTQYAVAYLAVHKAGAVAVPVSSRLALPALERVLRHCGAAGLIWPPELRHSRSLAGLTWPGWDCNEEALAAGHSTEEFQVSIAPNGPAEILYTSGTVGAPKGVVCSHEDITLDARPQLTSLTMEAPIVFLHAFPPGTNAAQEAVRLPLRHGDKCGVALSSFDPERLCQLVGERRISRLQLVPALAQVLLESGVTDRYQLTSIERVVLTGAPTSPTLLAKLTEAFPNASIWNSYTLTEAAQARTIMRYDRERAGSVGRPDVGTEVRVVDDTARDAPNGQTGEIWLRRDGVPPRHYHDDPQATAAAFVDGWLRTGDLGHFDSDGYLYLVDRKEDLIVTGGSNVSSIEVEAALAQHPAVIEAAAFGLPHPVLGEKVAAAVTLRSGVSVASLRSFVRDSLGEVFVPHQILEVERLPRNAAGKVLKHELQLVLLNAATTGLSAAAEPTLTAAAIASIWEEVLNVAVGSEDDFFDRGGHSLAAARVLSRIEEQFSIRLPLTALFDSPTVAELAVAVDLARQTKGNLVR